MGRRRAPDLAVLLNPKLWWWKTALKTSNVIRPCSKRTAIRSGAAVLSAKVSAAWATKLLIL